MFNAISTPLAQALKKRIRNGHRQSSHLRIAYLVSRYPAISHTFILREIEQLRTAGVEIQTASINLPDIVAPHIPDAEGNEIANTWYVKRAGVGAAALAHLQALLTRLPAWLRGAWMVAGYYSKDGHKLLRNIGYFTEALMLAQWMERQELNHLHVHFATAAANVGLYLKHMFGVGFSITVHGPDEFDNVGKECLLDKFSAADFLVCISHFAQSQVMRILPSTAWHKIEICQLGVDPERYHPQYHAHCRNAALAMPAPVFRILCVGRLCAAKGQHILLQAAQILLEQGRHFQLCIVGSGPDLVSLQNSVQSKGLSAHVAFTGALVQADVRAQYANADVFVMPSFAEGIPVVLMEAMACGVACIASRINGIGELIRSEQEGILFSPSDIDALVAAIKQLMDNPQQRTAMGANGRARVLQDFALQKNCHHLHQIFQQRLEHTTCKRALSTGC